MEAKDILHFFETEKEIVVHDNMFAIVILSLMIPGFLIGLCYCIVVNRGYICKKGRNRGRDGPNLPGAPNMSESERQAAGN